MIDPLIVALFDRLPEPGTELPVRERARWLAALDAILNMVYPAPAGEFATNIEVRVFEPDPGHK